MYLLLALLLVGIPVALVVTSARHVRAHCYQEVGHRNPL